MKRRLITSLYLCLAALTACQAESAGPADTQEVARKVSSGCDAEMPETPFWNGEKLCATEPTETYLFYQDLERRNEWVLVLVDYEKGSIPFGTRVKTGQVGQLLSKLDWAAAFTGGRQPNPPPPPADEWRLSAALIEWARLAAPDKSGAEEGGFCQLQ